MAQSNDMIRIFCEVCLCELKDQSLAMFTNCGHLACMKCQTALDFCSVCKLPASVLTIAHLGQQAPHLQHLFRPIWPDWDQLKQAAEVTHILSDSSRHSTLKSVFEQFQSKHQLRIIEQLLSENHKNQLQMAGLVSQVR